MAGWVVMVVEDCDATCGTWMCCTYVRTALSVYICTNGTGVCGRRRGKTGRRWGGGL